METSIDAFGDQDNPEKYIESFLHVRSAYKVVAGHPAGKMVDFFTKPAFYSQKAWSTINELADRTIYNITNLAIYFGMNSHLIKEDWVNPDGPGFAAYLRRAVPGIVTWRWPNWLLADAHCLVTNEMIVIDPDTKWSWIYFRAGSYFINRDSGTSRIVVKIFFGRTQWRVDQSPIHVFKPETTTDMSWQEFSSKINVFMNIRYNDIVIVDKPSAFLLRDILSSNFPDREMAELVVF